jgi:hypothetical protein
VSRSSRRRPPTRLPLVAEAPTPAVAMGKMRIKTAPNRVPLLHNGVSAPPSSLSLSLALAVPFNFVFWADCFAVSCFWCVCAGDVESALRPGGGQQRPGSSSPNSALPCTALHFLHFTCSNRCNQNDFFSRLIRSSVFFFRRQIIAGGQRWVLPGLQAGE